MVAQNSALRVCVLRLHIPTQQPSAIRFGYFKAHMIRRRLGFWIDFH